MTAKEYLRQAYRLNELIDSRITELERLRDYSTRLTSCSFEGERVSKSRSTEAPFARIIEKIVDLEKVINRDIDRYVDLKTEMNAAIDRVSNVDERLLLRYRYLNNYNWDDIAHNLMQAIARVNRVFKDKPGGLVVDYIGIADNLRSALAQYTPSDKKTTGIDPQIAIDLMLEKYEQIQRLLHGLNYSSYLTGSSSERIQCIVAGVDFVLGRAESDKKEFLNLVAEIGKAYALCSTSDAALQINVEISYFKAVKSGIIKILPKDKPRRTKDQIEYEISQLVSKSVISEEVVDILASVGLNKPDISILSDEFLEEVKGLPQKNLALELLRRLLDGKIKSIAKKNVVQAKKFSEMLEASVNQYEKRSLETAEVIKALVDMAKDMNDLHKRGTELGLSDDELAFYDAISSNESAKEFYENDILKQIAKELTISIKSNIKVDWDIRESVRAQMRITIKRLLRKYKYPPDKQPTAVELIIEQAEKMCEEEFA